MDLDLAPPISITRVNSAPEVVVAPDPATIGLSERLKTPEKSESFMFKGSFEEAAKYARSKLESTNSTSKLTPAEYLIDYPFEVDLKVLQDNHSKEVTELTSHIEDFVGKDDLVKETQFGLDPSNREHTIAHVIDRAVKNAVKVALEHNPGLSREKTATVYNEEKVRVEGIIADAMPKLELLREKHHLEAVKFGVEHPYDAALFEKMLKRVDPLLVGRILAGSIWGEQAGTVAETSWKMRNAFKSVVQDIPLFHGRESFVLNALTNPDADRMRANLNRVAQSAALNAVEQAEKAAGKTLSSEERNKIKTDEFLRVSLIISDNLPELLQKRDGFKRDVTHFASLVQSGKVEELRYYSRDPSPKELKGIQNELENRLGGVQGEVLVQHALLNSTDLLNAKSTAQQLEIAHTGFELQKRYKEREVEFKAKFPESAAVLSTAPSTSSISVVEAPAVAKPLEAEELSEEMKSLELVTAIWGRKFAELVSQSDTDLTKRGLALAEHLRVSVDRLSADFINEASKQVLSLKNAIGEEMRESLKTASLAMVAELKDPSPDVEVRIIGSPKAAVSPPPQGQQAPLSTAVPGKFANGTLRSYLKP